MTEFLSALENELKKELPGTDVQWQMASSDRYLKAFPRIPGPDAQAASVLVLLFPCHGNVHTLLMQRPEYKGIHGGQISFPGGKKEDHDRDSVETALREAKEETGIDPGSVNITGILTPLFIPVSNMLVTPVLGWTDFKPRYTVHPREVAFLIEADLNRLLDPSTVRTKPMQIRGETIEVKYFAYDDHVIWGATAMIINELLAIIRRGQISVAV